MSTITQTPSKRASLLRRTRGEVTMLTLVRDRQGLLWESPHGYRSGIDAFEADRDGRNGPGSVRRFCERWRPVTRAQERQYRHEWGALFPAWPGEWASR